MKTLAILLMSALGILRAGTRSRGFVEPTRPTRGRPIMATTRAGVSARSYQINKDNVKSLSACLSFDTRSTTLKCTPLEVNGILYLSSPDNVWAIDARTGRQIWHFSVVERVSNGKRQRLDVIFIDLGERAEAPAPTSSSRIPGKSSSSACAPRSSRPWKPHGPAVHRGGDRRRRSAHPAPPR